MRTGVFRVTRSARLLPVQEIQWASNKHFRFRNDAFEEADGACKVVHSTGWRWLLCARIQREPRRLWDYVKRHVSLFSILTARPSNSFSPNISPFILPTKKEERARIFSCTTSNRQFRLRSSPTTNGISLFLRNSPRVNSWNAVKTRFKEPRRRFLTGLSNLGTIKFVPLRSGELTRRRDARIRRSRYSPHDRWNFIRGESLAEPKRRLFARV